MDARKVEKITALLISAMIVCLSFQENGIGKLSAFTLEVICQDACCIRFPYEYVSCLAQFMVFIIDYFHLRYWDRKIAVSLYDCRYSSS